MPTTEVNTYKIHYEVHGDGAPLVILNGIMMSTVSWKIFLPAFENYKVILLDFVDQGQSQSAEELYDHSLQVEAVRQVLDHLGIEKVFMTGISYGAQIALQFALNYEDRVQRLVLFNGAAYTTPWLKDIGVAWQLAARKRDPELFYHVAIPYIYSPEFFSKNNDWMTNRKKLLLQVFTDAFLQRVDRLIESSAGYDVRDRLNQLSVRTLVVGTDRDYITPIDQARALAEAIPECTLVTLEGCGHASMYEMPESFITLVTGFMNDRPTVTVL